ncbi:hypothetical protein N7492_009432 [Penicillium capsulatum]|uniref:GET complex, subunit GET2 n=1 Tax=Penicillium capsulatum TaxID=69766 RepID=A0A9W9LHR3_9EURO|nr:hypothetical protein N7492_009432 [Penicillium capsulatum]KAJ6106822.1 hypothetical protein N7512_010339 [Penicillium capsulatum]
MTTPGESPAQKAARQRRERREAKIRDGGSARLDKITNLSGRTPQSAREEGSPSPSPQPAISPSPSPLPQNRPPPAAQPDPQAAQDIQAQQEAFRAMLRQVAPDQGQDQPANEVEDPTMKMLASLMGSLPGDPSGAPPSGPGAGGPPGEGMAGLSPATIASALGLPPFLANMVGSAMQAPNEAEQKKLRTWKILHVLFAVSVAVYLLFVITTSVATFGSPPPKPATAQNPFAIFVTGELLLTGARVLLGGKQGVAMVFKLAKDVVRDASLVLFALGLATWYYREWQDPGYDNYEKQAIFYD